jgi:glycosyltransferase involved in cell wall biosynthesis
MGDDRRIRVLLAITRLELGGAQRVALHTAATLDRDEFVVGLAWGPGDLLDEEARSIAGLEQFPIASLVRPIAPLDDTRALAGLRRAIRGFRPDVVHTHSSKAGILGRLAARFERVPSIVHTVHGFGFTPLQSAPKRYVLRTVEKLMARVTDHFVMVSNADRRRAAALGLVPLDRSRVIRAGIDLGRFRSGENGWTIRESYGIPVAVPLVTQVGNFKPQKAPLDFVRVAEEVADADPTAWFLMIGDGPLRGEAEARVWSSGIGDRFVFGGWSDDIPGVLAATTVSVLTSRHEGLPCSVVESLAAGVPMVATAVDGTVEVVRPGENGFLAPAGDVRALAEGVKALLSDPERRRRFARAAREGLDEFDRDLMVRKQEELYRWIGTTKRS